MNRTLVIILLIIVALILVCGVFLGGILIGTNFLNQPLSNLLPKVNTPTLQPTNTELVLPTATIQPSDTPTPTLEPTSTQSPTDTPPLPTPTVMITNVVLSAEKWENSGWMKISSKECHTPKTQCWKSITHQAVTSIAWMEPVYIDPAWENPFLVFWSWHWVGGHNWYGINYPFGFIEIKSTNQPSWARLGQVDGLKDWYREVKIDLSEFKSQEIYIRFYCQPVNMQTSYKDYTMMPYTWIISDVSIETNRVEP